MPVSLNWGNPEKTILVLAYTTPWTWQEFDTIYHNLNTKMESLTHKVDLIIDIQRGGLPPQGAMLRFKKAAELNHPYAGNVIFVGPRLLTQMVNSIMSILKSAFWGNMEIAAFQFVPNLDAAYALCRDRQASAPEQYGLDYPPRASSA